MKRPIKLALAAAAMIAVSACADLNVQNPNEPDTNRALSSPSDVEALIAGSFRTYYVNTFNYYGPGMALGTMSNEWTSSWGNSGMRDYSSEPRIAINNSSTYTYAYAIQNAWYNMYRAIKGASDGLRAINGGLKIVGTDGVDNTARATAWAHFVMGISYGFLSNLYDKAFEYDETTDLQAGALELKDYKEINAYAMTHLNKAIDIASKNSFTIPDTYVNGVTTSSADFVKIMHSYAARYMAQNARTVAERQALDWTTIAAHADAGLMSKAWGPQGDAYNNWWDDLAWASGDPGWGFYDLQSLGVADVSGGFQAWIAKPPASRTPFVITSPDRRVMGAGGPKTSGTYVLWHNSIPFLAARGTYHFSNYNGHDRWGEQGDVGTGQLPGTDPRENVLIKAEALYWKGDKAGSAALVNQTRVANGQLPPVDANGASGTDCVPKLGNGTCGNLLEAIKYEKLLELFALVPGGRFFDERAWGDLVKNTATQFPVPGKELDVLQLPAYTFGGEGGQSAAPGGQYGRPMTFEEFAGPSPAGLGSTVSAKRFAETVDFMSTNIRPTRSRSRM